jgi:ssDNA-binding replication factor A large subunit
MNLHIRATCFNAQIDQFDDQIQIEVDKVYLISGGNLMPAQKKFNTLNHECDITLDFNASIQICPDDNNIQRQQYNFRQISELENIEVGAFVDLVGVITSVSPSSTIRWKDGLKQKTLQLKDMSGWSVEITFWGIFCDAEGQQLQLECDSDLNPILALKNGRVTDFNGRSLSTMACFSATPNDLKKWTLPIVHKTEAMPVDKKTCLFVRELRGTWRRLDRNPPLHRRSVGGTGGWCGMESWARRSGDGR